jgi:hypothetical protein
MCNALALSIYLLRFLEDAKVTSWYPVENNVVASISNITFSSTKFVRIK